MPGIILFPRHYPFRRRYNMFRHQYVFLHQLCGCAAFTKGIIRAYVFDGYGKMLFSDSLNDYYSPLFTTSLAVAFL
jgi:hypothetical protein